MSDIHRREIRYRIAAVRRQVKQLVAIAAERAAQAESIRSSDRFRLLTEAETGSILGGKLLAAIAGGRRFNASSRICHWQREGKIRFKEDVLNGIERMPEAFLRYSKAKTSASSS